MSQLIMVIDDEAGVRDLLGDALKLAGFETITAADAMIAQTLLRNTKPDLLIVDINMPMMDGFEFIERIRSNGDNTPALMLSARGDRADITRGLTLGADDYVTKPFSMEELRLLLERVAPLEAGWLSSTSREAEALAEELEKLGWRLQWRSWQERLELELGTALLERWFAPGKGGRWPAEILSKKLHAFYNPDAALDAALGSGQTVRVGNDTLRDFRRLRGRLGPNSAEWRAFQDEATDRLIGNNPNNYGEAYRRFAARNPDVAALLVPADRRAELLAAQGEAAGRQIMTADAVPAIAAVPAGQRQDALNAAAGVIERGAGSGNPQGLIQSMLTPEQHARNVALLGSEEAALAYERRLDTAGRLVRNAEEIRSPMVPQISNPQADTVNAIGGAAAGLQGAARGMLFAQAQRWMTKFRIDPQQADRITQAALDPAQTDAILREVRRGYGPSAERALRGIIRRARRAPGTVGSAAGALNGNAE